MAAAAGPGSSRARAATPRRPSIFWPRRDVFCTSATGATTTRSTGSRRTKQRRARSAWRRAERPIPAYWMRTYYRHARVIYRRAALLMEHLPAPVSFYRQFRRRRTPIAGTDFLLDQGRIDVPAGAQFNDTRAILRIFSLMATHGYTLSQAAEDRITDALPVLAISHSRGAVPVERAARGAARAARRACAAHHARAGRAGDADSRVSRHRRAGDPRQLSPLHRRRAHLPGHRQRARSAPAGARVRAAPGATAARDRPARSVSAWRCCCTIPARRGAPANTRRRAWNWPTAFWRGSISTPKSANRCSS